MFLFLQGACSSPVAGLETSCKAFAVNIGLLYRSERANIPLYINETLDMIRAFSFSVFSVSVSPFSRARLGRTVIYGSFLSLHVGIVPASQSAGIVTRSSIRLS